MAWKQIAFIDEVAALTTNAPADADFAVAAVGVGTAAAKDDHKHDLNEGIAATLAPVDGTAEALGTNDAVPHLDHIHALGPLVANLDFNQQQAVSLVLEAVATAPDAAAEVEGQIYFDTTVGDKHAYVWVV